MLSCFDLFLIGCEGYSRFCYCLPSISSSRNSLEVSRNLLEISRNFPEMSRIFLEMSRNVLENSWIFLGISQNVLEMSRNFLEISRKPFESGNLLKYSDISQTLAKEQATSYPMSPQHKTKHRSNNLGFLKGFGGPGWFTKGRRACRKTINRFEHRGDLE